MLHKGDRRELQHWVRRLVGAGGVGRSGSGVTRQDLEPDHAVLACRVGAFDDWCHNRGGHGTRSNGGWSGAPAAGLPGHPVGGSEPGATNAPAAGRCGTKILRRPHNRGRNYHATNGSGAVERMIIQESGRCTSAH